VNPKTRKVENPEEKKGHQRKKSEKVTEKEAQFPGTSQKDRGSERRDQGGSRNHQKVRSEKKAKRGKKRFGETPKEKNASESLIVRGQELEEKPGRLKEKTRSPQENSQKKRGNRAKRSNGSEQGPQSKESLEKGVKLSLKNPGPKKNETRELAKKSPTSPSNKTHHNKGKENHKRWLRGRG